MKKLLNYYKCWGPGITDIPVGNTEILVTSTIFEVDSRYTL